MNVSQLAVYQVPSEAFKMRKRNTVPFYNRRRALKQRYLDPAKKHRSDNTNYALPLDKQTWTTTANCSSISTVTSTIFVADCGGSTSIALPNTTYIGPPLPCLPTPDVQPTNAEASDMPTAGTPSPNCTCQSPTIITKELERHPKAALRPTPTHSSVLSTDKAEARKRAAAWDRIAYYTSAAPAQATGFSFLANLGDPRESGTFD